MAEAYSGLRIRRKRVHSAKCSCCCSDDEHASGRKEEGDDSSKNQTAARSRQRSKVSLSEVEDENNNNNNSRSLQNAKAENSKGGEHCLSHDSNGSRDVNSRPAKKRQVRTLRSKTTKKAKTSQQGSKDSEKRGTEILLESSENKGKTSADRRSSRIAKGVVQSEASQLKSLGSKKKNAETDGATVEKPDSSKDNSTGKQKNGRGKSAKKRKGVKQKETFQGSDSEEETQPNINTEIVQSKLLQKKKRVSDRKLGNGSSQISSKKHKKSRNGQESDSQNAQQSTNSKGKINIIGSKSEDLTVLSKEVGESSRDSEKLYAKGSEQDERKKTQCKDSISTLDDISKTKIRVFDHLFQELKKCQGQSKTTMASAAAFLLGINMEQLSPLVRHRDVKSRKTEPNNAKEVAREKDKISIEKGFRENEEERRVTEVCESDVIFPAVGVQSSASQFGVAPAQQVSRASNAEEMNLSQAAEALVSFMSNPTVLRQDTSDPSSNFSDGKSKGERHLSQSVEQTTKASESNWAVGQLPETVQFMMQAGALQALAPVENQQEGTHIPQIHGLGMQQPQVLPQMPLSSLMTVLPQLAMTQNNLATLSQFMAQSNPLLNVSTAPSTTPTSTPTAKAPVVSIPPVLFGSHPPLLSFTQMSASSAAKTFVTQSNTVMRSQQQPLKGMEEVVGNVGANASSMLWNLKPAPVVYLASPQTLGGVPRNLVPSVNQNAQGIPLGSECDPLQSGVTSVQQNFDISPDKALRINPGVTRPILPKEHSVGSSQALPSGAVSKVVSQPVGDTSGGAQQGSLGMSHHRAMNSVSSTTLPTSPVSGTTSKSSSTSASLTAKQAVKRFVHERTRSAELRREGSLSNMGPLDEMQQSFKRGKLENIPSLPATGGNSNVQQGSPPKSSDFNLQQAATTLLSIAVPEGAEPADREESPDEPEEEVVFTSKGVFRVGDVDVDPQYNRMGREGYTCGKCGKIFTSLSYLARHIKRVCPDMSCRKWKCNMCDKAFRHPFGLQQHIYTHTGERPHKCPQCPKAFYSSNDLRRHSRIHSGERPYQCKHCQKTFATTISLKTHTYIHTGEKPHKCPHCPKTFATSSKLGRHIVTHSEQRPFSCDQCPKAFNRSGDLRRHSLHVHETREKPSECDECNAPVSTTAYLNMHQNTLKAETPATKAVQSLKCSVCGQEFSDLSDLDKHQKTHKTAAGKFA